MGRLSWPEYGYKSLGEAIESSEKSIEVIKTNKYSKKDLLNLTTAIQSIIEFVINDTYENKD